MTNQIKSLVRRLMPRKILKHRILAGVLRGHYILTSWHDYPAAITGRTEKRLLDWFAQNVLEGETWLDIGAHYGYTAIALCRLVGSDGRVFAFEPMISTAGYLAQTRLYNSFFQLHVMPFALGEDEVFELSQLPVTRGMVDSTLQEKGWMESFFITSLDWLWLQICREKPRIDGIKIDVQGGEIQALKGMQALLLRHKPKLVIEIHDGVDRQEFLTVIKACGYDASAVPIEPVENESVAQWISNRSYYFRPLI